MNGDKISGQKGFAGLDSMVSEVETPKTPPPEPLRQDENAVPDPVPAPPQPAYTGNPSSGSSSGKWWAIGIGLVVFFIWVGGSGKQTPARSPSYVAPAPAAAPYYPPASTSYEPVPAPAPAYASNDEEIPPVGSGLVFNRSQIRYCLSEKIRISAWQTQVNEYSETSVDAFNEAVNDYNMRCSNFRYRGGMLESVRSEVEPNRYALQSQGLASAAANP